MTKLTAPLSLEAQNVLVILAEPGAEGRLQNPREAIGVTEYDLITRGQPDSLSAYYLRAIVPARVVRELSEADYLATITNRYGDVALVPTIAAAEARAVILS